MDLGFYLLNLYQAENVSFKHYREEAIPVGPLSKVWFFGYSLAEGEGSKPAGNVDAWCVCWALASEGFCD